MEESEANSKRRQILAADERGSGKSRGIDAETSCEWALQIGVFYFCNLIRKSAQNFFAGTLRYIRT
jgi:hypothetical protein